MLPSSQICQLIQFKGTSKFAFCRPFSPSNYRPQFDAYMEKSVNILPIANNKLVWCPAGPSDAEL